MFFGGATLVVAYQLTTQVREMAKFGLGGLGDFAQVGRSIFFGLGGLWEFAKEGVIAKVGLEGLGAECTGGAEW